MMKPVLLEPTANNKPLEISREMTIKGKKNSKIKIITNRKRHHFWGNIFRRKRIMSEYFSDSAFGSQSDTKVEYACIWEDPEYMEKYRARLIIDAHNYPPDDDDSADNSMAIMGDPEG